jgi:outer membrane protein TolC
MLLLMVLFSGSLLSGQEILTLQDAFRIGLENNYSIIIRKNDARIAENNNSLGNAGFLPELNLSATQNNTITNTVQETFVSGEKEISGANNRSFNAGYNYNQLNSETGYLKYNQSNDPSFGLSLTYPLFDGFNINREIKNARVELNTMETYLKETDLGLHTDLYKIYNDYITNLRIIGIELINQEVAKENVEIAFEKYRLGSINDIELRETQKKYIDAQYQFLLSQFRAKSAEFGVIELMPHPFTTTSPNTPAAPSHISQTPQYL